MKIALLSTSTYPGDQGLRTMSSCLKNKGYEVKMYFMAMEENYSKLYPEEVLQNLWDETKEVQLVGISAYASTVKRAKQLIDLYQNSGIPVVWGGPHPTFFPEDCINKCNIIGVGEAEEAIIELADKLEKGKDIRKIKNLWIRKNGKEYRNDVRAPPKDLDVLAPPDYEIKDHKILEHGRLVPFEERHIGGIIYFQTERGCPQACSYCTNNILREIYKGKSDILRTHSVDYVIDYFVNIKKKFPSISAFDLRDETFLIRNIEWIREFSKKYKEKVGIRFKCLTEPASMGIQELSEEKIRLLVEAGLTDIIIGIQSGSDQLNFKLYNRFISAKQVIAAAEILNKFKDKLSVMYDVISSNPYEKKEDILATIKLVMQLPKPFFLSVNNLVFFEGTPLYKKAVEDGLIKDGFDSASELNYWDRWKHIKLKKTHPYLNLVLNLMRGKVRGNRYGIIPDNILKKLIDDSIVNFNLRHTVPTYIAGSMVQFVDNIRENVAKPMYKAMPTSVKMMYDRVRFKA